MAGSIAPASCSADVIAAQAIPVLYEEEELGISGLIDTARSVRAAS
jgi:hypothetical protein